MSEKNEKVLASRLELKTPGTYLGLATLNDPDKMNPLPRSTFDLLHNVLREFSGDASVRAIAIIGSGKAFSAGGDLKAYLKLQKQNAEFWEFLLAWHSLVDYIQFGIPKPVVALVNGVTAAGGIELLLACDLAFAAASAQIGDAHLNFGQMGGGGVLTILPRKIHPNIAREILFTAKFYKAEEFLAWGLLNKVVPDDQLLNTGIEFANAVASKSPLAVANMKHCINQGLKMRHDDSILLEYTKTHHYCLTAWDADEGLNAFNEKRKPKYEGR